MKTRSQRSEVRGQGSGESGEWRVESGEWAEDSRQSPIPNPQSLIPASNPQSLIPSRSAFRLPPSAFTLVELLVVITIISMLVALLVPAVISARGRARIGQCTNNQHELALAIMQYDGAKKRLPGYVNRLTNRPTASPPVQTAATAVTWVPVLLEYLSRNDLWEGASGWRSYSQSVAASAPRINELVCPDVASTDQCALTYVLNVGFVTSGLIGTDSDLDPANEANPPNRVALFRNLVPCTDVTAAPKPISLSSVASPSRCPMISERELPIGSATPPREWKMNLPATTFSASGLFGENLTPQEFGFAWPATGTILGPMATAPYPPFQPPTPHRGIVVVTFCDGHTQSLSDDTDCSVYQSAIR